MNLLDNARKIAAATGKPVTRQLLEALQLKLGKHRVGLSEYFEYGIWDPVLSVEQRAEFIGWRTSQELDRRLNEAHFRVLANDKLINYLILASRNFPIPKPIATFTTGRRSIANEHILASEEALRQFLSEDVFPCFVKPVSAGYGRGAMGVRQMQGDAVQLLDGNVISLETFLQPFRFAPYNGMLFQECIEAHPAIKALTGTKAISCVRMICFALAAEPVIHTAFFKIVTGHNMLDNFSHGDFGNCLGAIDIDTGTITHAIARLGPGGSISQHPTTQQPLIGFKLPDWEAAIDMVKNATVHFPGLHLQNWDVALTSNGPVLVELNTESELAVPQAISHRGLMDQALRNLLHGKLEAHQ